MAPPPDEKTYVEIPFIEQLKGLGWAHIEGDIDVPYLTERESFREVLLRNRLRKALIGINRDDEGKPWLNNSVPLSKRPGKVVRRIKQDLIRKRRPPSGVSCLRNAERSRLTGK
jgi:hypothetical protein